MKTRALSVILMIAMLAALFPAALAVDEVATTSRDPPETEQDERVEITVDGETLLPDPDSLPDSGELFAAFVQREFDREISGGIALFGTAAGDRLAAGSLEKTVYDALKPDLGEVADGTRSSTAFTITSGLDSLSWTQAELGGVTIVSGGSLTAAAKAAVKEKFAAALDTRKVLSCLLADCPYELYWFDKTAGASFGYSISADSAQASITKLTVQFSVIPAYAGSVSYTTNTAKTGAASAAVANAKTIVSANAAKTDRAKLEAYRAKICDLVSYDSSAAGGGTVYGDPWQLIYVFDGNSGTNVVCEGYAKAFQYLCDLSTFSGDVTCHTVTGTMTGGTGAGDHMWNVVKLEGKNLLVDVTNCDSGTIGADTQLFLVAVAGTYEGRTHTFSIGSASVTYTYDDDQEDLFCSGWLALTPEDTSAKTVIQLLVTGYDTADSTVVSLYQNGTRIKIAGYPGGQTGQLKTGVMEVRNVTPGVYDLVVSKSGCLDYTIRNVVVTAEGLDLTSHSDPAVKNITLLTGDVNGDGSINEGDVSTIRLSSNINKTTSAAANKTADVNGDGSVNEGDVSIVRLSQHINKSQTDCIYYY